MTPGYVKQLVTLMKDLGIAVPNNIRCDQKMTARIIAAIQGAVDTDQAKNATGNAVAADVVKDKTFSNAAGIGLVGTLVVVDTTDANAVAADIALGKTAYVNGVKITGTHE